MKVAVSETDGSYRLEDARRPITIRHCLPTLAGSAMAAVRRGISGSKRVSRMVLCRQNGTGSGVHQADGALPLDQHPGEEYIYGYNTDILGAVIEVASGKNLSTFLTEELFEPLAMTDTHFSARRKALDYLSFMSLHRKEEYVRSTATTV